MASTANGAALFRSPKYRIAGPCTAHGGRPAGPHRGSQNKVSLRYVTHEETQHHKKKLFLVCRHEHILRERETSTDRAAPKSLSHGNSEHHTHSSRTNLVAAAEVSGFPVPHSTTAGRLLLRPAPGRRRRYCFRLLLWNPPRRSHHPGALPPPCPSRLTSPENLCLISLVCCCASVWRGSRFFELGVLTEEMGFPSFVVDRGLRGTLQLKMQT